VSDGASLALWENVDTSPHLVGRSGPWIDGWHLGPFDRFTVADLDGDGLDELFVRSPSWAGVLRWQNGGFRCSWISGDPANNANWIGGWHLGPLDRDVAVDLDGDHRDELFVRSPQWAAVFRWTGSAMTCPWMTGDPATNGDWIGGWHLGRQDRAIAGHFRGAGGAELFVRSPQWAGLLAWNGSALETVWMSGDPAANANWIGGWHLGPMDREVAGRFNGSTDEVFVRSRQWAALFRWNRQASAMECPWMTGDPASNQDWIGDWHLDPRDRVTIADIDADGFDEVFIRSASFAGLLVRAGAGLTSAIVLQGNIGTWKLNAFDDAARLRRRTGGAGVFLHHPWGWTATARATGSPRVFQLTSGQFRQVVAS
jgi:ribosome modulation factor